MKAKTQTLTEPPAAVVPVTAAGRAPSGIAADRRVQHVRAELAAAQRRERAQQRDAHAADRRALLEQLGKGRGVTDILAALAQSQDTAHDQVRRARLLREVLQELDSGAVAIRGINQRKARRFLAFLEPEIAWLENRASRVTRGTPAPLAA